VARDSARLPAIISRHAFCHRLYDLVIRKVICSTNSIESLNAFAITFPDPWPTAETY
jgi:hypothetical protein